jgi:hypothetical protein
MPALANTPLSSHAERSPAGDESNSDSLSEEKDADENKAKEHPATGQLRAAAAE